MPSRTPVLYVITRLVHGGAQRVVLDLLARLDRVRFDLTLAAGEETGEEGSLWSEAEALGIRLVRVRSLVRAISPWRDLRALRELGALMRELRPDIVHAHTSKAGLLACAAAHKRRVPAIVLAPHGHVLREGAAIPGVPPSGLKRRIIAFAAKHNARYAHRIVAPNQAEFDEGIALGIWPRTKCVIVPNGIDVERYRPGDRNAARAALDCGAGILPADAEPADDSGRETRAATAAAVQHARIVGVIARLTREKGVDLALEALTLLPGVDLAVIGDGPERSALEARARELGIESRCRFMGRRDDVERLLPAFDAVLVPSRSEAHGLVAAEALACEIPVAAADVGGLRPILDHGRAGTLVPPGDASAMAKALGQVFDDPRAARERAIAGRRHIAANYSLDAMVQRTAALYDELLGSLAPRAS